MPSADTKQSVLLPPTITVHDLAEKLGVKVSEAITSLIKNGVRATINDRLDYDTAAIIAGELGFTVGEAAEAAEAKAPARAKQNTGSPRPPVVAMLGHVDHGKTTLIDAIRGSDTVSKEAGGITQHISAYQVKHKGRLLTLLDTPGHEAFSALRQHGAALTDVAVIVVAADDGIKPQTKEAIEFATKAGVQVVTAITKVDKADADPNRTKQQLAELGLNPEEWGGSTVTVEVSGKTRQGVEQLLDMILLVADVNELKADEKVPAEGIVIESHMAVGKGPVATLLIEQGTLRPQQYVVAGSTYAKVRQLLDDNGRPLKEAGPSRAATVTGFKAVPNFGESFRVIDSEKQARRMVETAKTERADEHLQATKSITTAEDLLRTIKTERGRQVVNVIIKADVRGSLEALAKSVEALGNEEVGIKVVLAGVGNISESDISLAKSADAVVLGFRVSISNALRRMAARDGVSVKIFDIIYELLDQLKTTLEALLRPEVIETSTGRLTIKGVFRTTRDRIICGGEVTEGKAQPGLLARITRGKQELGETKVANVQRGQQDAKEVVAGELCGLELVTTKKIPVELGDQVEFFKREEKKRSL